MDFDLPYVLGGFFLANPIPGEASASVLLLLLMCSTDDELVGFGGTVGKEGMEGDPNWARWAASMVLFRESVV